MARFIFELEPVLKMRRREEQDVQVALAKLEQERIAIENRIRSYQQSITQSKQDLRDQLAPGSPVRLDAARLQSNASLFQIHLAQQAVLELAGVHKRLEHTRAQLLRAASRRKAIEQLREKRLEAFKREQQRAEAAAVDELSVMRHRIAAGTHENA